ncbi:MAG: hypothetical protein AB1489_24675 [Acidobacteriota bacterium]
MIKKILSIIGLIFVFNVMVWGQDNGEPGGQQTDPQFGVEMVGGTGLTTLSQGGLRLAGNLIDIEFDKPNQIVGNIDHRFIDGANCPACASLNAALGSSLSAPFAISRITTSDTLNVIEGTVTFSGSATITVDPGNPSINIVSGESVITGGTGKYSNIKGTVRLRGTIRYNSGGQKVFNYVWIVTYLKK